VSAGGGEVEKLSVGVAIVLLPTYAPAPAGVPERVRLEPGPSRRISGSDDSSEGPARLQPMHELLPTPPGRPRRSTARSPR
jgi:hypothetical protein